MDILYIFCVYPFEGLSIALILVLCYVMLCSMGVMAKTRDGKCKIENSTDIQTRAEGREIGWGWETTIEWVTERANKIGALLICLSLSYSLVI